MHSCMKVKALIKEAPLLHAELKEIQESLAARFTTAT